MTHKDWRAELDAKFSKNDLNTTLRQYQPKPEQAVNSTPRDAAYTPAAKFESQMPLRDKLGVSSTISDLKAESNLSIGAIIDYAIQVRASDIHFIVGSRPAIRSSKLLEDMPDSDVLNADMVLNIAKSLLNDKQLEALHTDGEVDLSTLIPGKTAIRINAFKQKGNISMALRLISDKIPEFEKLNLPDTISQFANHHKGLILVTGATGSGKSTTLASMIDIINRRDKKHIITIEDPIEYVHVHKTSKVNQREIGSDTRSFASALRASLREDPDIILVGEMRDPETISIALSAAETGHLVFSTLHTVGAAKTIDRVIDAFPPESQNQVRSQLATVLNGVISQEMMPKIGGGVAVACEIMISNAAVKNLIREGKPHQINSIIQTSQNIGMISMDMSLADLVKRNLITKEIAIERSQDESFLLNLIGRK